MGEYRARRAKRPTAPEVSNREFDLLTSLSALEAVFRVRSKDVDLYGEAGVDIWETAAVLLSGVIDAAIDPGV